MSTTLQEIYNKLRETFSESDARYVIEKRTGLTHADMISNPAQKVDAGTVLEDLKRHQQGEPLSRIYGEREFWGMPFSLSPATLDPRPDTETLIEAVLKRFEGQTPPETILDLGTGTGCILIALLSEFPNARGVGVDLSGEAVKAAQDNAQRNNVGDRASFIQGSWYESLSKSGDGSFDLVVSNPPYIENQVIQTLDESVQKYDPILALDGGKDGLQAYREIFSGLFSVLKPGGRAFFEIGFDQEKSTRRLSEESRLLVESVHADLAGHARVIEVVPRKSGGDK